jgi:hypothetical protein
MKATSTLLPLGLLISLMVLPQANAQTSGTQRPNILVIFGDDIGQTNVSAYTHGLMGYQTPNIDRLRAKA